VQPETIERSLDGRITYASRAFLALYDPLAWPNGLMYPDSQVPQQINLFLRQEHGFQHEVCWSEQGAQQSDAADFDTDNASEWGNGRAYDADRNTFSSRG